MLTAPYMAYRSYEMSPSYLSAVSNETKPSLVSAPVDFNDISAPETMPAGCVRSYQTGDGTFIDLAKSFRRGAA
jgi:hypothetical protein